MRVSTIGLAAGAIGGLAAYFNSPEIQQAGEVIRLGAAAGVGAGTGLVGYLGARMSAELLQGGLLAWALTAAIAYGGYEASDIIAGNIVEEIAAEETASVPATDITVPASYAGQGPQISFV